MILFGRTFIMDFHLWVFWNFKYGTEYGLTSLVNINLVYPCAIVFAVFGIFSERLTDLSRIFSLAFGIPLLNWYKKSVAKDPSFHKISLPPFFFRTDL